MLTSPHPSPWLSAGSGDLDSLKTLIERTTEIADYTFADRVEQNIVLYSAQTFSDPGNVSALMSELNRVFDTGPGIVVIKGAVTEAAVIDRATALFERLIGRARVRRWRSFRQSRGQ